MKDEIINRKLEITVWLIQQTNTCVITSNLDRQRYHNIW